MDKTRGFKNQTEDRKSVDDSGLVDLKIRINELIFEYAPEEITLKQSEQISVSIFIQILDGKYVKI